jgi:hypothetical protein
MTIYTFKNTLEIVKLLNTEKKFYATYQGYILKFVFAHGETLYITDVTNAGRPGKVCRRTNIAISYPYSYQSLADRIHCIVDMLTDGEPYESVYTTPAKRVFDPTLKAYNPLKEIPAKWTLTHVVRALLNGQAENVKCTGVYTDDYAYDAASNFGIGEINAKNLAIRLIECPSGWHAYAEADGTVHVNCHSFDNNKFTPLLRKVAAA